MLPDLPILLQYNNANVLKRYSVDYRDFCQPYFGKFFHHLPTPDDERLTTHEFELDFTRYLSYAYDHLGEHTVMQWFGE